MAGHSQFKNIMHRKGRQDKARAKLFSKLGREITTAAKMGMADPAFNPRLRMAIIAAPSTGGRCGGWSVAPGASRCSRNRIGLSSNSPA